MMSPDGVARTMMPHDGVRSPSWISHVDAARNRRNIVGIDIFPEPGIVAAGAPASHVEQRQHRFSPRPLFPGDTADYCRPGPVPIFGRDLLFGDLDPVRSGLWATEIGGPVRSVILVQRPIFETQEQELIP